MEGWIKLHRQLLDWEWYSDSVVKDVFIHLLLCANHKPTRYKGRDLKAGCVVSSTHSIASALGFSEQQVRTAIKKLQSTGEIERFATNKNTIFILHNYENYQAFISPVQHSSNNQITLKQQSNNIQATNEQQTLIDKQECRNVRMQECESECAHAPTREEVEAFAKKEHLLLDCQKFYNHYAAVGWKVNGQPIVNWKAKARAWSAVDKAKEPDKPSFDISKFENYLSNKELRYG